jgi:redox-sensing transcriptional repressor
VKAKTEIPVKTVERLTLYRRLLKGLMTRGLDHLYSHQIAELALNTPAQVRRDLMLIGFESKPRKGYAIHDLVERINGILDHQLLNKIALLGIGNLGRAILSYFNSKRSSFFISCAFDVDESKINRTVCGCRCFPMRELGEVIRSEKILLAIVTVPGTEAQVAVQQAVQAGIRGLLNFAPSTIVVPSHVCLENVDLTMSLEKVAFFTRRALAATEGRGRNRRVSPAPGFQHEP